MLVWLQSELMTEELTQLRANNAALSSSLETVVSSHSTLQVAVESLRSDLAQRDTELTQLRVDLSRVTAERDAVVCASVVNPTTGCTA